MQSNFWLVIINLAIFIIALFVLRTMAKKFVKFSVRVAVGLALGIAMGIVVQQFYGANSDITKATTEWVALVGTGYVRFLQMMVTPLIMVSILGAILKMGDSKDLGKKGTSIVSLLIGTAVISAGVGILTTYVFKLSAPDIESAATLSRSQYLSNIASQIGPQSLAKQLQNFFPSNPFGDMAGLRNSSILGVVIFFVLFAISALQISKKKPEVFASIKTGTTAIQDVVMRMVTIILRWTPYGIMSLMLSMMATSPWQEIYKLITFVVASYAAMIVMFIIHLIIVAFSGLNPFIFMKKSWPVLVFSFASRSSASAIPLNTKAQTKQMGVDEASASLSASLGASMGQNGCAGIYPAMLAMMIYSSNGTPITWTLILQLLFVIAISSFGVAGVGGGATFAAIIVLSILGLPVELAGLLISIEPLIDMGRTALNVSDSVLAGVVTSRMQGSIDMKTYNDMQIPVDQEEI
ncbi:MAG: cation:dicarboxylate symporter family transporter [Spirochaetia bacterium]